MRTIADYARERFLDTDLLMWIVIGMCALLGFAFFRRVGFGRAKDTEFESRLRGLNRPAYDARRAKGK